MLSSSTVIHGCHENSVYFELQMNCLRQTINLNSTGLFSGEYHFVDEATLALRFNHWPSQNTFLIKIWNLLLTRKRGQTGLYFHLSRKEKVLISTQETRECLNDSKCLFSK